MRKILFSVFTVLFVAGVFVSCDEIEKPYLRDDTPGNGNGDGDAIQNVLIEEFTGHKCVNCPAAHDLLGNLKNEYGDSLIIVSIHAGFFATPDNSGAYTTDLRTTAGEELHDAYGVSSYPSGMINRGKDQEETVLRKDIWNGRIKQQMGASTKASLSIEYEFDAQTRNLSADVDIEFLDEVSGVYRLSVYITEDGIIAPQKNDNENVGPVPEIMDYEHNHVLRGTMNGTWGDPVSDKVVTTGTVYSLSYDDFAIPEEWNEANLSLIAFVYSQEDQSVLQAEKVHIE